MKFSGVLALSSVTGKRASGTVLVLRATRCQDDDWRWVDKVKVGEIADAVLLIHEAVEWIALLDAEERERIVRFSHHASRLLAEHVEQYFREGGKQT